MRLVKDPESATGRYVNPSWVPGEPATFAVVIGVSGYTHLSGGAAPADEPYGLGQLHVSALTALDFFEWLARDDLSPAVPAECWLLLSPVEAEQQARPDLTSAGPPATFENCRRALREWYARLQGLRGTAAGSSRSLFFFSGHGVEIHHNQQVLLPADYLAPLGGLNDAISTANLVNGVASLQVPHHTFFVDACRNDVTRLREQIVDGTRILDERISALANQEGVAPVLYATAAGTAAFQYRSTDRRSLYGTALLEGLRGLGGIDLECDTQHCAVRMFRLQEMMKRRVDALVHAEAPSKHQRVLLGGRVDDLTVTRLPAAPPVLSESGGPPDPPPPHPLQGMGAGPPRMRAYDVVPEATPWALANRDWNIGHHLLGSELVTGLFLDLARVQPLGSGVAMSLPDADARLTSSSRSPDYRSFTVALELPYLDTGWWLTFPTANPVEAWSTVLPGDLERVTYFLDLDCESLPSSHIPAITRVEAGLSLDQGSFLGEAAGAWWAYETRSSGAAAALVSEEHLADLLLHKVGSPLGATIAAQLLLELRSRHLPESWLMNLVKWFEGRPDPPLLLAEHHLRYGEDKEWLDALRFVTERGLPHLQANLSRLDGHLGELERRPDLPGASELHATLSRPLTEALARLRPGGLFATFAGDPAIVHPGILEVRP